MTTLRRLLANPAIRILLGVIAGALFGLLMARIPSPTVAHVFWIGNLCAPWLVLSFFSGAGQSRRWMAALAGALTDVACVAGFYSHFLFLGPTALGLPASTAVSIWIVPAFIGWVAFIRVWVAIALAAGLVYGLLGRWWRKSGAAAAAVALGIPFIAEPSLWTLQGDQVPIALWIIEMIVGVLVAVVLLRRRSAVRRRA